MLTHWDTEKFPEIELTGEETGMIPTRTWKRVNKGESWATGDTYLASMGQGYISASPLQVLGSFVTVANKGIHIKPTIIKEVLDDRGNVLPFTPMLWISQKTPKLWFMMKTERRPEI